jgi:hypothetical protein
MAKTATKTATSTVSNLSATIDGYGELKALIAQLDIKKKEMEASMADLPAGAYEGELFRLTISDCTRESPDAVLKAQLDEVVEKFRSNLSYQYLSKHTKVTSYRVHKPTARTGKGVA